MVQNHLTEIEIEQQLPDISSWNAPGNVQSILGLIDRLATDAVELRARSDSELGTMENQLAQQQSDLRASISRLQREINFKEQHLQELQKTISDEELAAKKEKRKFLLAMRPKIAQLEKLQRRIRLTAHNPIH
jgi:chromosome segregation ATPase